MRKVAESYTPPPAVAAAAARGLALRQSASPSNKGGLTVSQAHHQGIGSGVQRAVDLKNRRALSAQTVRRMHAFFSRHEKNKAVDPGKTPAQDKGHQAWLLWGGDPGRSWARGIVEQMEKKAGGYMLSNEKRGRVLEKVAGISAAAAAELGMKSVGSAKAAIKKLLRANPEITAFGGGPQEIARKLKGSFGKLSPTTQAELQKHVYGREAAQQFRKAVATPKGDWFAATAGHLRAKGGLEAAEKLRYEKNIVPMPRGAEREAAFKRLQERSGEKMYRANTLFGILHPNYYSKLPTDAELSSLKGKIGPKGLYDRFVPKARAEQRP